MTQEEVLAPHFPGFLSRARAIRILRSVGPALGLLALMAVGAVSSGAFLTITNLTNVLRQISIMGFASLGMTLVILSRGIDLSVAGVVSATAVGFALLLIAVGPVWAMLIIIVTGACVGLANGLVITKWRIEPFVVTLGMSSVAEGMAFYGSGGRTVLVPSIADWVRFLANGSLVRVPIPSIVLLMLFLVAGLVMRCTPFGRHVFAIGGNEQVAAMLGVNVRRIKLWTYTVSGALAAVSGIFHFARTSVGDPTAGFGSALYVIASVIVGGTRFEGGRGGVGFTIIGLLIMGVITNLINLMGAPYFMQLVVQGLVVITAAILGVRRRSGI